jgi:Flp pilus assembly CpaE family ATPase
MVAELMPTSLDTDDPMMSAPSGKVLVVHSAKGGVGTTTIAVNVAASIHERGQRVCLVDLDLGCGDVAVSLRLEPRNTIMDLLVDDPDVEPIDTLRTTVKAGFDCILAPAQPVAAEDLPSTVLADLVPYLCSMYDAVVIDTPVTMTAHTRAALQLADAVILVATPEVPSLRGLTISLDQVAELEARSPRVVLNRVQRGEGIPASEISAGLGIDVVSQVPLDPTIARAGDRGEPLVTAQLTSPFTVEIDRLVDKWFAPKKAAAKIRPLHRRRGIAL